MGLFSSIGNIVNKVVTAVVPTKEKLQNVANVYNSAFNPFNKSTTPITANTGSKTLNTALEAVANHPYVSAGIVAGGITLATKPALAVSAAKSLIPTSTKGKIAAAVITPIVAGAVIQKPAQTLKAVVSTPSSLLNFGGNAANLAASPSISNLKTLVSENPVIAGAAGAGALVAIGGGLGLAANTAATLLNTRATNENTNPDQTITGALPVDTSSRLSAPEPMTATNQLAPTTALTAPTQTITNSNTSIRRRKSSKKALIPSRISQKVNVIVDSSNNKRYINRAVYA